MLGRASALFSASQKQTFKKKRKVIIVDVFQISETCILDIFISLKCVLILIRKLIFFKSQPFKETVL